MLRAGIKPYANLKLSEVGKLLKSSYHEERLFAVLLLVDQYAKSEAKHRADIFTFYLQHTKYINNWDLVDCSAHKIVGEHLKDRSRKPLYTLARSVNLWERRIAVISTLRFIKEGDYADVLMLSKLLLEDDEDLIHKAVGWMLREVGNRDRQTEESFLEQHCTTMPRTMLRYAIEKLPEARRQSYLHGKV